MEKQGSIADLANELVAQYGILAERLFVLIASRDHLILNMKTILNRNSTIGKHTN